MARLALLVALLAAVLAWPFVRSSFDAAPPAPPPFCKRTGFLGLSCSTGCVRRGLGCAPSSTVAAAPLSVSKADALMRKRSVDNCLAAADIYEAGADTAADTSAVAALKLKAADALNCAMRIKSTGNILLLEGTLDTPANKKFWGTHGPRALALVRAARAAHAPYRSDAAATNCEMDSFMYASSSKGILRQAVTGAGTTFRQLSEELATTYEPWDSGVGHCYLGGFYTVAPWPLGDKKRGLAEMEAAYAYEPRARRNAYYACLLRYMHDDHAGAVQACEAALAGRCDGPTMPDYCPFLTEQIQRLLGLARARLKK